MTMSLDDNEPVSVKTGPTYGSYLKVQELTSLQRLISDPPHHDELLFIIVHQTYELWFKQLLHEVETVMGMLRTGQVLAACRLLSRVYEIEKVLVRQVNILETMTPMDFLAFRERLRPASGFQSAQFREFEYALGLRDERYLENYRNDPVLFGRLQRRLSQPSLSDVVFELLLRRGLDTPPMPEPGAPESEVAEVRARRVRALGTLYAEFEWHYDLFMLAEALVEVDEQLALWRQRHIMMVERVIGGRSGTGGSPGASYLKTTLEKRAFPEFWDVRTSMATSHEY